jgi:hypothetical protein
MAGEVSSGRPMARHGVAGDGRSGVPSEARESVLTEDRPFADDFMDAPHVGAERLDELARRRATAEQAAMVAEIDAAAAAGKAAAAIATAARAAEEAEAAAEAAARASCEASAAIAEEERTSAALQAEFRPGPGQGAWVLAGSDGGGAPRGWSVVPAATQAGPPRGGFFPPGAPPTNSWPSMIPVTDVAPGAPWNLPPHEAPTVEGAAAGGRRARRHAAEAAEAETTVIPVSGMDLRPDELEVADPDPECDEDRVAAEEPPVRRLDRRHAERPPRHLPRRPVVAVMIFGVLLILAGLILAIAGPTTSPAPTVGSAPVPTAAPEAPAPHADVPGPAAGAEVDPKSDKAVAFLSAVRAADIPTTRSGRAETETAAVICQKLDNGISKDSIARAIPAALPSVSTRQAADVVELAQELYCS